MTPITQYCKKFYKKPAQFLDNDYIKKLIPSEDYEVTVGLKGGTKLADKHLKEFFLWLSQPTKQMVMDGKSLSEIKAFLDKYQRGTIPEEQCKRHYEYTGHNNR
jgi:hypothetical protein